MGRRAKEPHLTKTNRLRMQRQTLAREHLEQPRQMLRRLCRERLVCSAVPDPARVAERDLPVPPVVVPVPEVRVMADPGRIARRALIRRERKKVCVRVRARMPLVRRWVRVRRVPRWPKAKCEQKVIVRRDSTEARDSTEVHAPIEARVPKVRAVIVRRDPKAPPPVVIVRRDSTEVRDPIVARDPIAAPVPTEVRDRIIEVRDRINEMVRSKRRSLRMHEASFLRPNLRHRNNPSPPSWFRRPNPRLRPRLRRAS